MARTEVVKPRNDAYTGILAISFLALVGATALMAMDADSLGKAPDKLKIDVPGATPGKAGEGLKRAPLEGGAPAGGDKDKGGMGRAEPRGLPPLPEVAAAAPASPVTPVKAETKTDDDAPPLPPPAFVPPGN
jgi:hypothetical protein